MSASTKRLYEFAEFRLDPAERLLTRQGTHVPLAPKAFEMLVVLVSNSGRLLTKDELMSAVWADAVVEENNLDKNISALRKALGENGAGRRLIETVRGHGYRFNAPVTEILTDQGRNAARVVIADDLDARDEKFIASAWPRWWLPPLVIALSLAVAAALWLWQGRIRRPEPLRQIKMTRLTNGGNILHAVLSPDGKRFAYTEYDGEIANLWLRQVAGGEPVLLAPAIAFGIPGLTFAPDGQDIYFVSVDQANPRGALYRVPASGGAVTKLLTGIWSPVTFSPDGQRLAFIRPEGMDAKEGASLVLADKTGGNERIVLTLTGLERFDFHGPSWAPDGKEIACQLHHGLTETNTEFERVVGVDVGSGALRPLTAQRWDGCGRLAWLRDGRGLIMVGTKQGESDTTARDAVWFISQPEGLTRRITTDLNRHFFNSLSVTADGQSLLVIPFDRASQIWSVEARGQGQQARYDARSAVQLTTGAAEGRGGIVSLDDGQVVYVARTGDHVDLWRMNEDGGARRQLTTDPPFLEELRAPPDGRYFVFASKRNGASHLFRVNRDGANLQQLTSGESVEIDSDCSPDGRWIAYSSIHSLPGKIGVHQLWKIPAEGGAPVRLSDHEAYTPHFSPDGQWLSFVYPVAAGGWKIGIMPADGGPPVKTFDAPKMAELNVGCRWTPDGQALTYIVREKNFSNLWMQPVNGDAPRALTDFTSGEIYNYDFTRNGQRLFLARGYSIRDVLLIREFR